MFAETVCPFYFMWRKECVYCMYPIQLPLPVIFAGVYEPLKSVSLVIRDTGDVYKVLHLKAANAWTCQL